MPITIKTAIIMVDDTSVATFNIKDAHTKNATSTGIVSTTVVELSITVAINCRMSANHRRTSGKIRRRIAIILDTVRCQLRDSHSFNRGPMISFGVLEETACVSSFFAGSV